jgi:hypothetical protein
MAGTVVLEGRPFVKEIQRNYELINVTDATGCQMEQLHCKLDCLGFTVFWNNYPKWTGNGIME